MLHNINGETMDLKYLLKHWEDFFAGKFKIMQEGWDIPKFFKATLPMIPPKN